MRTLELNLPTFEVDIQQKGKRYFIKCLVRKKWLVLTPEEWVRQHFLNYLFTQKQVSKNLTSVEYGLDYNGRKKRIDILVFNKNAKPSIMVECKAPHIKLSDNVIFQIATYNAQFLLPQLCITNGMEHLWFQLIEGKYELQEDQTPIA